MAWHTIVIATFIVSLTVYIVASNNDQAGWIYVLILLLGISLLAPDFSAELNFLGGHSQAGQPLPPPGGGLVP